ncbi:MAG: hypothetical protein P4M14_10020 [Gammaproteobacteria bacterium]|nr:hypothetical protein [Gammaproteobacteria bacterium]
MPTSVEDTLQNAEQEIKKLKSLIDHAVSDGNMQNAEKWIGSMNTLIRQLDHLVEILETTEE